MKEIWKLVDGFENNYKVSNFGRVYSIRNDIILKLYEDAHGYLRVNLCSNGYRKNARVHRLVAMAFVKNENNYEYVNHIDEKKTNNYDYNLEWCSVEYNNAHGTGRLRASKNTKKRVGQFTLDGKLVREWDGITDATECGYSKSSISACCNSKPHCHTYKGYIWKFI